MNINNDNRTPIEKAKDLAYNQWDTVFGHYAAMDAAIKANGRQVPCPANPRSPTSTCFRLVTKNGEWKRTGRSYHNVEKRYLDGIGVLALLHNGSVKEALASLFKILDPDGNSHKIPAKNVDYSPAEKSPDEVIKITNRVQAIWQNSTPAAYSQEVAAYLKNRGLKGDFSTLPHSLRYHPSLRYPSHIERGKDADLSPTFPALLGVFRDKHQNNCTLHRHFIKDGHKARVDRAKLVIGAPWSCMGGYIYIDDPLLTQGDDGKPIAMIGFAEGMETALAVREAVGIPMRATYSNSYLSQVEPLVIEGIPPKRTIHLIWADKDRSKAGIVAAKTLWRRLTDKGYLAMIYEPEQEIPEGKKGIDWLDVYKKYGASAFPISPLKETGFAVPA